MQSGAIISASSEHDANHAHHHARLDYFGGGANSWCASINDNNQWLQFCLPTPKVWHRVEILGRGDAEQWVSSYLVVHSNSGINYDWRVAESGKVFPGNVDMKTIVGYNFTEPFKAKCVRIKPITWHAYISMRCEMYYIEDEF